jgi:hypothetical protein
LEKRRIQAEVALVNQSLSFAQGKPKSSDTFSPPAILGRTTPKHDVVPVYTNRYRTRDQKTESEVVLETQQRETQVVSHQLPALLKHNATSRITYRRHKAPKSIFP